MRGFVKRVSRKVSKLPDEQVEQLLNAISDENEMLDSIMESLANGLVIVDKDWYLLQSNKAAERFLPFKFRLDDPKIENIPVWDLMDDDEISDFLHTCYINDTTNVCQEFTTTTEGGSIRFIQLCVIPLVQKNNLIGSIVSATDITEKRNQEILLHRMESLAGLTNLAASVAHEIKNPLGAISIHIQLIQKAVSKARTGDGMLPDKKFVENYLDVINEEIDNLNKIVVDFLFAVRPVSAKLELVDPDKLLTKFVSFFKPEFEEKLVTIHLKLGTSSPRLLLDEKLFREVIINLSQNALAAVLEKFPECRGCPPSETNLEPKENPGKFSITTSLKNEKYIIVLEDNGIGMSEVTLSHIFEPYYTTKPNGTGLGMTMVYKIIKEFSGDIEVKSKLGSGTRFTIKIPVPQLERRLLTHSENSAAPVALRNPAGGED
ncbi:MAG: ATP-binding protein [Treponema sp.]|nr:ATP-binding protein [Treponema sp.]